MKYHVQVQRLSVDTYEVEAPSKCEIKKILAQQGAYGLARKADRVEKGSEEMQLLSVSEMN